MSMWISFSHSNATQFVLQRFLPSEFGHDVDRADPVEPGLTMYLEKRQVRRFVEKSGVPYTYICCNSIASWPYFDNKHPSEVLPPLDQFQIYGDGSVKGMIHILLGFFCWVDPLFLLHRFISFIMFWLINNIEEVPFNPQTRVIWRVWRLPIMGYYYNPNLSQKYRA